MNILHSQQQLEDVYYELSDRGVDLWSVICQMDENEQLPDFLVNIGHGDLADRATYIESYRPVKVLVVGDSRVELKVLQAICKQLGFNKNRFDFVLGYDEGTNYDYENLKNSYAYGCVIFGAIGHSTKGKGDYSSIIEAMRYNKEFPSPIEAFTQEGTLKITKTSFREALVKAVENRLLEPDDWSEYESFYNSLRFAA